MKSITTTLSSTSLYFIVFYLLFGLLHELSHVAIATILLPSTTYDTTISQSSLLNDSSNYSSTVLTFLARAIFCRYCSINIANHNDNDNDDNIDCSSYYHIAIIKHFGWIFSTLLSITLHYCYRRRSNNAGIDGKSKSKHHEQLSRLIGLIISIQPIVIIAAYTTALEAISTDLFSFGISVYNESTTSNQVKFFCGNFGIILLNSSWINSDGGKRALDMLEKMVEVTMMRGAQSGGVITYEPIKPPSFTAHPIPIIRGVRSRVVNAKRTNLANGIRTKIDKDNCSTLSSVVGQKNKKLKGWNSIDYNPTSTDQCRMVRSFFGHTRFATSSKASFDGTHPHRWSPRRTISSFYPFQSETYAALKILHNELPVSGVVESQMIGVENYVTHNGDFEYYKINGKYYDIEQVQLWLEKALRVPMPSSVDSAAIAGVIDLLRTQGSWALSVRCAVSFLDNQDINPMGSSTEYPTIWQYEEIGKIFEEALVGLIKQKDIKTLESISSSSELRETLMRRANNELMDNSNGQLVMNALSKFVGSDIEDGRLGRLVQATVSAFFDNDLLHSMRLFLERAKGSFGVSVTTSIDTHRQVVFAAKGQTMSIAFYPRKGLICFGSEQAAVKAGLSYDIPTQEGGIKSTCFEPVDENAVRLDLDDLGGEIALLDWGFGEDTEPSISPPNRDLRVDKLMGGAVNVVLLHQENTMSYGLHKRLVQLENNEFIMPLRDDSNDPVLSDIQDIPKICANIQTDWQDVGLNRMTAWHLSQCIRQRLQGRVDGTIESRTDQIDILVTGCEVSLWLGEQFCADLQKCFPKLGIKAVSSNKLLGMFGQELPVPTIGFPYSERMSSSLKDTIVIIVSHSGGTFAPLACSNLMQSFTSSLFVVTSEFDTQIGKQLRSCYGDSNDVMLLESRIFTTDVDVRPAEPCSVSVAATHQLLTNIFEHICVTIIGDAHFRSISGSIITERDLQTLEKCNRDNIKSLERIVGTDRHGKNFNDYLDLPNTEKDLRSQGDEWSEHILEQAKAYIMSIVYIIVTVTSGYPLISGIAYACGLREDTVPGDQLFFLLRFFDALVYIWLPQINCILLRIIQKRNLRHRMVGRTVVIGDIPWVSQCAEAFLSKIFACSYSIAGLNVLSANPSDHLVHRHTHRVVRGSLLVCGRPDGRLAALTTLEASTCLAVNQASSIQSIGGTCESITIGHNKSKLPLSHKAIFLETDRPKFLCEKLLKDADEADKVKTMTLTATGNLKSEQKSFASSSIISTDTSTLHKLSNLEGSLQSQPLSKSLLRSSIVEDEVVEDDNDFGRILEAVNQGKSSEQYPSTQASLQNGDQSYKPAGGIQASRGKRRQSRLSISLRSSSIAEDGVDLNDSSLSEDFGASFASSSDNEQSDSKMRRSRRAGRRHSVMKGVGKLKKSITRGSSGVEEVYDIDKSKKRTSAAILGAYSNMEKAAKEKQAASQGHGRKHNIDTVIQDMIKEKRIDERAVETFHKMDVNGNGCIEFQEFVIAYRKLNPDVSMVQLQAMFDEADVDSNGTLDLQEFIKMSKMPNVEVLGKLSVINRDDRGLLQVMPSTETYFGEELEKSAPKGVGSFLMSESQHLSMQLYESRIASMQRFVSMTVMFHQMGSRVQSFFPKISFGILGYRMDRTHSIMRIATTASPVSGADVRERMVDLHLRFKIQRAVNLVSRKYREWRLQRDPRVRSTSPTVASLSEDEEGVETTSVSVSKKLTTSDSDRILFRANTPDEYNIPPRRPSSSSPQNYYEMRRRSIESIGSVGS